ncbi:unnamed protein product [Ceratitis capitata]|uniref:(Mediterranean fruit fly) hypothetical protein n=1 Tax=Ceratitis capitata TaxID=7213 RepID=A0A811VFJ6_CERCA|nr:unnamed protein product [Ceratitis capitata]
MSVCNIRFFSTAYCHSVDRGGLSAGNVKTAKGVNVEADDDDEDDDDDELFDVLASVVVVELEVLVEFEEVELSAASANIVEATRTTTTAQKR